MTGEELKTLVDAVCKKATALGIWTANFPWYPEVYHDEKGNGTCLGFTGDGLAIIKFEQKPDGSWIFIKVWEPERYKGTRLEAVASYQNKSATLHSHDVPAFVSVFGKTPDEMVGQPVTEKQILSVIARIVKAPETVVDEA